MVVSLQLRDEHIRMRPSCTGEEKLTIQYTQVKYIHTRLNPDLEANLANEMGHVPHVIGYHTPCGLESFIPEEFCYIDECCIYLECNFVSDSIADACG